MNPDPGAAGPADGSVEIAGRRKGQPAPPHIVWRSLTDPHEPGTRPWLSLRDDEVEPVILSATSPVEVVWSSIFPQRPDDRIRFQLAPDGYGTLLTWSLTVAADDLPDAGHVGHARYRLNQLVNAELRYSYG
ncbi:hypothetical protein [Nakamurella endophytica]|uniref:Uncharacterized protein n=1 Tax=Nakamurella endophytica TaxID=1748367 RepID=A0A917SMR6_9ACTN|nr:hypothetical protein [Nakamurella endophytica]GGL89608.1 hypothetical protein GCM10011594_06550 [Nakamurella endophytica]